MCIFKYEPEDGDVVGSRPTDDERRVRRLGDFSYFVNDRRRFVEPNLRYPDLVLEFKVTTRFRFGHQQQVVE